MRFGRCYCDLVGLVWHFYLTIELSESLGESILPRISSSVHAIVHHVRSISLHRLSVWSGFDLFVVLRYSVCCEVARIPLYNCDYGPMPCIP